MKTNFEPNGVLYVEDNHLLRRSILPFLKRLGFQVHAAANATEAMTLWTDHSDEIQLILTDISLPDGISGLELAKEIRARRPELPVILASGYMDKGDDLEASLGKGAFFIPKPFDPQALSQVVKKAQLWAKELGQAVV